MRIMHMTVKLLARHISEWSSLGLLSQAVAVSQLKGGMCALNKYFDVMTCAAHCINTNYHSMPGSGSLTNIDVGETAHLLRACGRCAKPG